MAKQQSSTLPAYRILPLCSTPAAARSTSHAIGATAEDTRGSQSLPQVVRELVSVDTRQQVTSADTLKKRKEHHGAVTFKLITLISTYAMRQDGV